VSGIYIVGTSLQSAGLGGALAKYDLVGNQVWVKSFDSPDATFFEAPRISVDHSGVYLALVTSRSGFLTRYDSNGEQVWSVIIPSVTPASIISVSVGQDGVYLGGKTSSGDASLSKYGQSSSLVFFGVNPPFSFGLVGLLGGLVVLSIFRLRRQRKSRFHHAKSVAPYRAPKPSDEESKWMKRPA
jgi:hypothetical protein